MIKWLLAALGGTARLRQESDKTSDPSDVEDTRGTHSVEALNDFNFYNITPSFAKDYTKEWIRFLNGNLGDALLFPAQLILQFDIPKGRTTAGYKTYAKIRVRCLTGGFHIVGDGGARGTLSGFGNNVIRCPSFVDGKAVVANLYVAEGAKFLVSYFWEYVSDQGGTQEAGMSSFELTMYVNRTTINFRPSTCAVDTVTLGMQHGYNWRVELRMSDTKTFDGGTFERLDTPGNNVGYYTLTDTVPLPQRNYIPKYERPFHNYTHVRIHCLENSPPSE